MSDIIRLLPDSVANQIAAGEVIQRPASVIKELVENAIDAGAKTIKIFLKDAGRTLIQVVDDGCGMSETDARMAFERHATSKIRQATDLYTLHTMGFRGEALPSIAAVSQIDLRTMPSDASIGTRLLINGSKVESQEPEACAPGTNMMVKNLFFNIPVRRKFLKKDSVELANVMREFERLSLVNINTELTISHNDVTLHHLLPATFKRRIVDIFGKNLERNLIPVETDTSIVRISGYIGLPESAKRRGYLQYLTVNGRNMRHPYFHKAIMQCYADLIPTDQQPNYFINFTVDPESIDVNIHPTKNEIKFENEQPIWQILTAAIRESLSKYNVVPSIEFDLNDAPEIPPFNPDLAPVGGPTVSVNTGFNPFETDRHRPQRAAMADWEKLYDDFNRKLEGTEAVGTHAAGTKVATTERAHFDTLVPESEPQASDFTGSLNIKNRYIALPSREGIMLIDQHRAHVAVLFEKYMAATTGRELDSQQLLFPEEITLSPSQNVVLSGIIAELASLGFEVKHPSDTDNLTWSITAVPSELARVNPAETLLRLIEASSTTGEEVSHDVYSRIALTMAREAAISPGQPLTSAEREQLVASLLSLPNPGYTPDGQATMVNLPLDTISDLLNK